ncbi:MAG: DNA helicase, partial [Spirochaetaceae bacterium]|nr:DNA helicase [Spirochaetaceae bacterium]
MTAIGKDIFRSIHEGKWLYIEYQNKDSERTKYWIAVHNINLENETLEVTGLHIGLFTTKELTIYIEKILSSTVMEGTFYRTNKSLIDDIEAFPQKYSPLFSNIANLKTLNYLADCNK